MSDDITQKPVEIELPRKQKGSAYVRKIQKEAVTQYKQRQDEYQTALLRYGVDVVTPDNLKNMLQVAVELATGSYREITLEGRVEASKLQMNPHSTDKNITKQMPEFTEGSEPKVTVKLLKPDFKPFTELATFLKNCGVDPMEAFRPKDTDARAIESGVDLSKLSEEEKNHFLSLMNKASAPSAAKKEVDQVVAEIDPSDMSVMEDDDEEGMFETESEVEVEDEITPE